MSAPLPQAATVEECDAPAFDFAKTMARVKPLVIRGLVRDWPIVQLVLQSDTAFAQQLAQLDNGADVTTLLIAPQADGILGYKDDLSDCNYRHFKMPITIGLQRLAKYGQREHVPGLVIQSVPLCECLPELLADHTLPLLDSSIGPRLWMSNCTVTPTHFDSPHNIACVVGGARRFTLFLPEQLPDLHVGPLAFAPSIAAISLPRLDRPDDPRYPRLKLAPATAQTTELQEGDAIYIPRLWWHRVESLEQLNALVNYWWSGVDVPGYECDQACAALFDFLLPFRTLPPAEHAARRNLFDHYVFGKDDRGTHISEQCRGVLGRFTAEVVGN
ncbi:MAG: cupin-like domain-containing protein [Rhodanobacteraceae bacterium]